ncbi:MAG: Na(+)/H(+) antiporter subunit B [Alphaproteobacteria bacterium]|nr:Na(+)/H(+) antiporter subunit B [Alphaproteobacteria bacterium]
MNNKILVTISQMIFPCIIALGFYVQINGSDAPGGGFQAGVIMASAFIMLCLVFGSRFMSNILTMRKLKILAVIGVCLYGVTGLVCMLFGGEFLNYTAIENDFFPRQTLGILLIEWGVGITVFSVFTFGYYMFATNGGKDSDA